MYDFMCVTTIYYAYYSDHGLVIKKIYIYIHIGVHRWTGLCPCRGEKVPRSGWQGGAGQGRQGDPLPGNPQQCREAHISQGLSGLQAGSMRFRPAQGQRQVFRLRCQRLQFCEELQQVLRRLRQDTGEHDTEGAGAHVTYPVVGSFPAGRSSDCAHNFREDDGAEVRGGGHKAWG